MRTHIIAAMMALIFTSACASHHRSVASVDKAENAYEAQKNGADGQMAVRDLGNSGGLR